MNCNLGKYTRFRLWHLLRKLVDYLTTLCQLQGIFSAEIGKMMIVWVDQRGDESYFNVSTPGSPTLKFVPSYHSWSSFLSSQCYIFGAW
jgi:hypothetical protein